MAPCPGAVGCGASKDASSSSINKKGGNPDPKSPLNGLSFRVFLNSTEDHAQYIKNLQKEFNIKAKKGKVSGSELRELVREHVLFDCAAGSKAKEPFVAPIAKVITYAGGDDAEGAVDFNQFVWSIGQLSKPDKILIRKGGKSLRPEVAFLSLLFADGEQGVYRGDIKEVIETALPHATLNSPPAIAKKMQIQYDMDASVELGALEASMTREGLANLWRMCPDLFKPVSQVFHSVRQCAKQCEKIIQEVFGAGRGSMFAKYEGYESRKFIKAESMAVRGKADVTGAAYAKPKDRSQTAAEAAVKEYEQHKSSILKEKERNHQQYTRTASLPSNQGKPIRGGMPNDLSRGVGEGSRDPTPHGSPHGSPGANFDAKAGPFHRSMSVGGRDRDSAGYSEEGDLPIMGRRTPPRSRTNSKQREAPAEV